MLQAFLIIDEALFIDVLRTGKVKARQLNPTMPYSETKYMTDDELKAVFAYLRSVPPVKHRVDNSLPPTFCKLCQDKAWSGRSKLSCNLGFHAAL